VYNQQNFHTSAYRGNVQGHDSYLRSDSQTASSFGGTSVGSQYRGIQSSFQPTGPVQSFYGGQSQNQAGTFGAAASTNAFHTAAYKGNQQGHDSYLRSDSRTPSGTSQALSASYGASAANVSQFAAPSYGASVNTSFSSYPSSQAMNPNAFHAANYRGNQPGHDQYLRADATSPSTSQFGGTSFGGVSTGAGYGVSSYGIASTTPSFGYQSQATSANAFHTSNYRGNQPGHDQYLRADATQPSQFGYGATRF
jgi:hypothetical protein